MKPAAPKNAMAPLHRYHFFAEPLSRRIIPDFFAAQLITPGTNPALIGAGGGGQGENRVFQRAKMRVIKTNIDGTSRPWDASELERLESPRHPGHRGERSAISSNPFIKWKVGMTSRKVPALEALRNDGWSGAHLECM